ncbi:hypothetical protein [Moorena producens]|uniref:hypothetical protein n=1 Tax=Moorena producens TaxID=1155739 RepID=UPI003C78E689
MQLTITNIISSLSSGHANLYVRYENIPGYWDGTFVCTIEKSPIVFNKLGNVGIGTNPPLSYEIYLRGSAFESTEGNKTYLKINNLSVPMTTNRGLNTVIFSPEGSYKTGTSHDVYGNANNWNDWADWINDANNVANGDVVAVASYDAIWNAPSEGSAQTLLTSINALKAFAVEQGDTPQPRFPYALLFIKGKTGAIEVAQPYKGPNAHIKTTYYKLFNYGNSSVEYKLDVNGNTNVNGTIYRGGNPLIYENYEIYLRGSAHESTEGNHNYLKIANVSIPMTTNRGLNTVILSPDGTYKTGNSHDVYDGNANNWNAWADWINDANNVANGDVVAVASFDAIKNAPSGGRAETLLRSINALKAFAAVQSHPRSPYALLFIKGKTGAIEVAQPYRGSNAHIKTTYYELFNYGNSSVVLRGMIMMWSGSKDHIPVGWALCDGTNGTPNLRDRFIVGAGSSYEVNGQGGQDTVTLTEQQMPSHLHSGSAQSGEHRHVIPVDTGGGGEGWGQARMIQAGVYNNPNNVANANTYAYTFGGFVSQWTPNSAPKEGKGEHTHNLAIARSGGGQGHENRPPYYALAYIMKL